jgi:anti-sigma regulatory factor (Ser/Thr protein kinase)
MILTIPTVSLNAGPWGIDALLAAVQPAWELDCFVALDFARCEFISGEAVAILDALHLHREHRQLATTVDWETVRGPIRTVFSRWEFHPAQAFISRDPPWMTPGPHSTIPIHHQDEHDPKKLIGYVREQIIEHPDMPRMTEELAKETRKALSEVFSNIFRHAESHIGGLALGQVYPNKKQFQLCVCDAGLGLVNRVQGAGHGRSSPTDAIRWALEKGNSTWTGPEPPGLA